MFHTGAICSPPPATSIASPACPTTGQGSGRPARTPAPPPPTFPAHPTATDSALTATLPEWAAAEGCFLFRLLLAAHIRCLAWWSNRLEVAVTRARREGPGVERLVGPLADTLPVLVRDEPGEPVAGLAARLRQEWLDSERHSRVDSPDLARLLARHRRDRAPPDGRAPAPPAAPSSTPRNAWSCGRPGGDRRRGCPAPPAGRRHRPAPAPPSA
ncbi:condensation domain-containing protein [Streptomyces lomondensis]|uniref:condensation domain-containing protein n=1 Tax=Streptomyces lomondensis TaxID=68229 RepID=UPI00167A71EF|nr:condensation domain-containing protein [Streptomyces lomondensis]MCF0082722.1 condensation domain-containing protein [Streptomyces lomondensis]